MTDSEIGCVGRWRNHHPDDKHTDAEVLDYLRRCDARTAELMDLHFPYYIKNGRRVKTDRGASC